MTRDEGLLWICPTCYFVGGPKADIIADPPWCGPCRRECRGRVNLVLYRPVTPRQASEDYVDPTGFLPSRGPTRNFSGEDQPARADVRGPLADVVPPPTLSKCACPECIARIPADRDYCDYCATERCWESASATRPMSYEPAFQSPPTRDNDEVKVTTIEPTDFRPCPDPGAHTDSPRDFNDPPPLPKLKGRDAG